MSHLYGQFAEQSQDMQDEAMTSNNPSDATVSEAMLAVGAVALVNGISRGHTDRETARDVYLAMRKLDPALAIPNDKGMRRAQGYIEQIQLLASNHGGWAENDPAKLLADIHDEATRAIGALAASPSPVEDDEMIERVPFLISEGFAVLREAARANQRDMSTWPRISPGEAKQIRDDFAAARAAIAATKHE